MWVPNTSNNHIDIHMVVPYTKGLSESIKNIHSVVGKEVYFRGGNTLKSLLLVPKYLFVPRKVE